jgi:hypothetical protein
MYVALSYDHRIIDGKESVSFLYKVKEMIEDPNKSQIGLREQGAGGGAVGVVASKGTE